MKYQKRNTLAILISFYYHFNKMELNITSEICIQTFDKKGSFLKRPLLLGDTQLQMSGPLPHLGDESPTSRIFCYKSVRGRLFLPFIFFFLRYIRARRLLTVMDVPLPSLVARNDHCKSSVYMERCSSASPPPPYDDAVREAAWPSTVSFSYQYIAKPK